MQSTNQALYDPVPPDFLKGIFLAPHNFSDPENKQQGEYVNFQLRKDLFDDAFQKVCSIEFGKNTEEGATTKIEKIEECRRGDSLAEMLKTRVYKTGEDELIRCEDWSVKSSSSGVSRYRVKLYQSTRDRFFSLVYPPKMSDYFTLYWHSQI